MGFGRADQGARERARPRPRCVLAATSDVRFLRVARFLLERKGVSLIAASDSVGPAELSRLIRRHRPRIVLVDADGRVGEAVSAAQSLRSRYPRLEVIVLAEDDAATAAAPGAVVGKWSSFRLLSGKLDVRWPHVASPLARRAS